MPDIHFVPKLGYNEAMSQFKRWYFRSILIVACVIGLPCRGAFLKIAPVVGVNLSSPNYNTPSTPTAVSSGTGFGFGGLLYLPLFYSLNIETGVVYIADKFSTSTNFGFNFETSLTQLYIPVLVRFQPISFISAGLGPYFGLGIGDITSVNKSNNSTSVMSYGNTISSFDFGLTLSAALEFKVLPLVSAFVDGRLNLGLKNRNSSATDSVKTSQIFILAGAKIGF